MKVGACYMLAVPMAVLISYMFEPYERQYVFTMSSETIMYVSNACMLYMLSSKKSSYR